MLCETKKPSFLSITKNGKKNYENLQLFSTHSKYFFEKFNEKVITLL